MLIADLSGIMYIAASRHYALLSHTYSICHCTGIVYILAPHVLCTLVSESSLVPPHFVVVTIPPHAQHRRPAPRRPPVVFPRRRQGHCNYCGGANHETSTCLSTRPVSENYTLGDRTIRRWIEKLREYAEDLDRRARDLALATGSVTPHNDFEVEILEANYPAYPDKPLKFTKAWILDPSQSSFLVHLLRRAAVLVRTDAYQIAEGLDNGFTSSEARALITPYFTYTFYR